MQNNSSHSRFQVLGGECLVSDDRDVILFTVLGPCVSAVIHDPVAGVGGMNHFLLPRATSFDPGSGARFGDAAMDMLVDELRAMGGRDSRMRARLFGGRQTFFGGEDVGAANAAAAAGFLAKRRIALVDSDLGGQAVRWVNFHPATGRTWLKAGPQPRAQPRPDGYAPAPVPAPEIRHPTGRLGM